MYSIWSLNITPNQILLIIFTSNIFSSKNYLYLSLKPDLVIFTFWTLYAHIAAPTKSMLLMIALRPCFLFYHFCNAKKIYVNMFPISFESVLNTFKYICVMCIHKKTFNFMGKWLFSKTTTRSITFWMRFVNYIVPSVMIIHGPIRRCRDDTGTCIHRCIWKYRRLRK